MTSDGSEALNVRDAAKQRLKRHDNISNLADYKSPFTLTGSAICGSARRQIDTTYQST